MTDDIVRRVKYPKTMHLPWSPGLQNDDRVMTADPEEVFGGRYVIVTEKMDGENTTMYFNHIHARSLDSGYHPSRTWVKQFWGQIRFDIQPLFRICGENMFAKHSIHYTNLESYFLGFSLWGGDRCFTWQSTIEWFEMIGITPVPVLYEGLYSRDVLNEIEVNLDPRKNEGYVVRLAESFSLEDFDKSVGKYVRKGHVQTDEFWMTQPVVPNLLKTMGDTK